MIITGSFISVFSAIVAIFAISIAINIVNKVYQENYKKPWLFIAISSMLLGFSHLLRFLNGVFETIIINQTFTEYFIYILDLISILVLTYGILLEYLILTYYKGKFVKMKFIPVQEGSYGGELDISVVNSKTYIAFKKDKDFLLNEFSKATKIGFEGFLITEQNPREIRVKFKIQKTPIAWVTQLEDGSVDYVKNYLDENSDVLDPLQLNNLISYIDNFLEQSQNPFVFVELDLLFRTNSYIIVDEFLRYLNSRVSRFNGILILFIATDSVEKNNLEDMKKRFIELE